MRGLRMVAAVVAAALATASCSPGAQRTDVVDRAALKASAANSDEWLSYGRDQAETRYSPLDQINDKNISRLGLAWSFETNTEAAFQATPLISNGVIYATGSWSVAFAIDARTGAEKWRYDPQVDRAFSSNVCCGPNNRGPALYDGKVFVGVLDGRLVALDQNTGKEVWSVKTTETELHSITGAPRVVNGNVVIGNGGAEYGARGYVTAYNAQTGQMAWRFYTVPEDPAKGPDGAASDDAIEKARSSWVDGKCYATGCGGTVWDALAYDAEANLLYIGTGNGSPWNREVRDPGGGDNLYLSSIVAVKADTGRMVWYYQTTPGESWDFTATQTLILADLPVKGRDRKVIMQAPKNGFFYVLDRITGELLSGEAFTDVNWASGIDMATGRPIESANARYLEEPELIWVGGGGAHSWHPMAYSPKTRLAYIPGSNAALGFAQDPNFTYDRRGRPNTGVSFTRPQNAENPPGPSGFLVGWDVANNKEAWRVRYPARPAGVLTTGGNLVIHGDGGQRLIAYTADKGEQVWEMNVAAGIATPMTYMLDGKQYVSVLAGRGNGRLFTFVLDGKEPMPVMQTPPAAPRGGGGGGARGGGAGGAPAPAAP